MVNVFIFHRDLRLEDNLPLQECLKDNQTIPIFIFTEIQAGKSAPIRSIKSIACLFQSLEELNQQMQNNICFFFEKDETVALSKIKHPIKNVYETLDITPYAKNRSERIKNWCNKNNINQNIMT